MRNGADCLSKWVGEAERQLRVTFEQVRNHHHTTAAIDFPILIKVTLGTPF